MTEESMMILGLLRDGKISAPEAERLLRAVRETGPSPTPGPPPAPGNARDSGAETLGEAAASAVKLARQAWKMLPTKDAGVSKLAGQIGAAAGEALRAAQSAAREVAADVGRMSQQTWQAWEFGGPDAPKATDSRPAKDADQAEATDTTRTDVTWDGADRLVLVNAYGDIRVTGRDGLHGAASATLTKTAWADTDGVARTLLQQVFLVSRVEGGACRVEVIAPVDVAGRLTVDYEIVVPQDIPLEARTTFGGVEAAGVSPALVARSRAGRLTVRRPWPEGAGDARLTTQSGDVLLDGWNTPGVSLHVETGSGDMEAQGLHCGRGLTLTSRSGDVTVTDGSAGARARVQTGSGGARLTRLRAEALDVETGSGHVTLRDTSGALTLKTDNGSVEAHGLNAPAVTLDTVSGDARLSFAAPFSGSVAGTTVSGGLTLALWDSSDTRVGLTTTSGTLFSALPLADRQGDGLRHLTGTLGDATGSITLQSASGDLRLEKDAPPKRRTRAKPTD